MKTDLPTSNTIAFLGGGWLGFPSAVQLRQKGYVVKVSTTTESKLAYFQSKSLLPYLLQLSPEVNNTNTIQDFLNADTLVINIPPGKASSLDFHPNQIKSLLPFLEQSSVSHIIYVSATSVYHEHNQEAFENEVSNATAANNQKLALAEDLLKAIPNKHITILRYGGLVGGTRNLLKFFEGKMNVEGGNVPVNFIHQKDAVNLLCETVTQQLYDDTFNVCAPLHPTKKEFYTTLATRFNAIPPQFLLNDQAPFKIVNAEKIVKALDYKFEFEDPLTFEYDN